MKKIVFSILSVLPFSLIATGQTVTLTLSNFSEALSAVSPWVWNSGTKQLTATPNGSSGEGLLSPDSFSAINASAGSNGISLTGFVTSDPGGSFNVSVYNSATVGANSVFSWSSFVGSQPVTVNVPFTTIAPGFTLSNIQAWDISDGTLGGSANLSFTAQSLSIIPEPSTYALMALGGLVLFFIARRRKAQA
jgi:hypothetical protein